MKTYYFEIGKKYHIFENEKKPIQFLFVMSYTPLWYGDM